MFFVVLFDMLAILKTFPERHIQYAFIRTHWRPLEQIVAKWGIKKNIYIWQNNCGILRKFGFQLPNDPVLELTGKHFSSSDHISLQDICIWPRLPFSGHVLMHQLWSTIIFPKMLHLKCTFGNSSEIYRILFFTHLYALLNNKSVFIPKFRYMLA